MRDRNERLDAVAAARAIVESRYPQSLCAIVGGSVLRGDGTDTSDLDLVVVLESPEAPFRESFIAHEWPVEAFVHTEYSYRRFFAMDIERRRPSLVMMCAEGEIVSDRAGLGSRIKSEAHALLEAGPAPLTPDEVTAARYGITDLLDDFLGCDDPREGIFIACYLAESACNLMLDLNHQWRGGGKWTPRAMTGFDPDSSEQVTDALMQYCRDGTKEPLIGFVEHVLRPVGGRLFEGYYSAANGSPSAEKVW